MADAFKFKSLNGLQHGKQYRFEDFKDRYALDVDQARDLFERFGPSVVELDLLMASKRRRASGSAAAPAEL